MADHKRKIIDFLKYFSHKKTSERVIFINSENRREIAYLIEIFINILQGTIKIGAKLFNRLNAVRDLIRKIISKKTSLSEKITLLKSEKILNILNYLLPRAINYLSKT